MRNRARPGVGAALVFAFALAGCSSGAPPTPAPALGGSVWRAIEIDGRAVLGGPPPELRFNGTRIRADGGCNTFSGSFTLDGNRIDFAGINSTLRMCDGPVGEIETSFLRALIGVTTMSFDDTGDLLLSGETVSVHLVRS
ncbi:MAG TPA: META domain-containing protein [Clostridia bacterium]|nr:META domain-containing protein [Clostridia bacterium]